MASSTVEGRVLVAATAQEDWDRLVTPVGINHEMRPWVTKTFPRGARNLKVDTVPLGRPVGRA